MMNTRPDDNPLRSLRPFASGVAGFKLTVTPLKAHDLSLKARNLQANGTDAIGWTGLHHAAFLNHVLVAQVIPGISRTPDGESSLINSSISN